MDKTFTTEDVSIWDRMKCRWMKNVIPGFPQTAAGWPVTPECLYWPKFLYERYKKPIYITENGMACADVVSLDGCVHDPQRIDFLQRYLQCLKRAAEEIDLRGYFQWTLTDNFEWAMDILCGLG